MTQKRFLPLGLLLLCAGCDLTPKYTRPEAPVPTAWASAQAGAEGPLASELTWQDFFVDANLRSVIQLALANNRDLRVAGLNVEQAQAMYRIQRSALFPDIGILASGQKYRSPEKMQSNGVATTKEQDSVNLGVLSWELDFFGRLRSLKRQALNQFLATEQAAAAARISLTAAVAQAYFLHAADWDYLRLAQETFETQKTYADLVAKLRDSGMASDLDLRQAQSQADAARVDMAKFQGLLALDRNALDLLAGTPVPEGLLPQGLDATGGLKDVSAGLPSEVLLQRPDILAAEYQLKAANASIGAARAAFFPRVTLTAGVGTMAPSFSELFTSGTRTWSFSPQIIAPIFAGGSLRASLNVAELERDINIAQYEKSIQAAFREVSDGLVLRQSLTDQLDAQRALVDDFDVSQHLSTARYEAGLDSYLGVLVAQRSLYGAQQGLVATRLAFCQNQITLYKALGGKM
jgi:multidrug efflux system outer membrane protein